MTNSDISNSAKAGNGDRMRRDNRYPGLHTQTHMRTYGLKKYYYFRRSGYRIKGEPGTPEFDASYEFARKTFQPKPKWKTKKPRKAGIARFVYFIQCKTLRHIKIGTSQHPWTRFLNVQTSCPDEVTLLGVIQDSGRASLERDLQQRFAPHRIRGEWYAENDELLALIAAHAQPASKQRIRHDFQDGKPRLVSPVSDPGVSRFRPHAAGDSAGASLRGLRPRELHAAGSARARRNRSVK